MELSGLISLIGEENIDRLKSGIVDLILGRIKSDLNNYSNYILYPPDFEESVCSALESTENKVKRMYKDAVIEINEDYINKMKDYMSSECADKTLRSKVYELAKNYYWKSNEYGKERKFANELFEILKVTQEQFEEEISSMQTESNLTE